MIFRESEDKPQTEENILKYKICDTELLFKMYKEYLKTNNNKMNNLILKWAKDLNRPNQRRYTGGK